MVRRVALRDQARVGALVEAPLLEADRERVHGLGRLLCGKRGEHGRVDAAREQDADRDVGEQVRPNGVAQTRAQLFDELRLVLTSQLVHGHRAGPRVALELEAARSDHTSR